MVQELPHAGPHMASVAVQAVPTMAAHEVNSEPKATRSWGMNHTENGWPKEVDPSDAEQVARWRKRVERDEDYINTVVKLGTLVEGLVKQNLTIDLFDMYFEDVQSQSDYTPASIDVIVTLQDPRKRPVRFIAWQGDKSTAITVVYSTAPDGEAGCTWSLQQTTKPIYQFKSSSPLTSIAHHPKEPSLLVAGAADGSVLLYDSRKGPTASIEIAPPGSHKSEVVGISWTQSKTGTELMTTSADGEIIWWDTRRPGDQLDRANLADRPGGNGVPMSATCLQYSAAAGPTKFLVGSGQGAVLSGNRKAKSAQERINAVFEGHHGMVCSIARHPAMSNYFMSAADWSLRFWAEDLKSSLLMTPYRPAHLTGAAWSQAKPSVAYAIASDGSFEAWDLLQSHSEPVYTVRLGDKALTALAVDDIGTANSSGIVSRLCAVGCEDGSVSVLRAAGSLVQQGSGDDLTALTALFELEASREKALQKARR